MITFEQFKLSDELQISINQLGFEHPTKIQEKSIPHIIEGKDVLGESATGSGKTLAFGCGVIEKVIPGKGLQALILTPTRELAEQVKNSIKELARNKKLRITSIYGGVAIGPQIDALERAEIAIATPGRFKDHMGRRTVDTSKIKVLVLDEADRMLDMGFIEDIDDIVKECPKQRQSLFFSATISDQIQRLAKKYMIQPIKVMATKQVDPSKLTQYYYDVSRNLKISLLVHLLKKEKAELVMVFCNTRRSTDLVVRNLKANGVKAIAIHGGFTQNKRSKTMDNFNDGKVRVLVCTDVAARGLHIDNVSHVYNYEIPNDPTDYVHRIGRTARAGEEGKVMNLLSQENYDNFSRVLEEYRDFKIIKTKKPYVEQVKVITEERRSRGRFGNKRPHGHHRRY